MATASGCHPRNPPSVSDDRTRHLAFIPVSCPWTLALLRSIDLFIFLTRQIGQTRPFRVPCRVRVASGPSPVPSVSDGLCPVWVRRLLRVCGGDGGCSVKVSGQTSPKDVGTAAGPDPDDSSCKPEQFKVNYLCGCDWIFRYKKWNFITP